MSTDPSLLNTTYLREIFNEFKNAVGKSYDDLKEKLNDIDKRLTRVETKLASLETKVDVRYNGIKKMEENITDLQKIVYSDPEKSLTVQSAKNQLWMQILTGSLAGIFGGVITLVSVLLTGLIK